MSSIILTVEQDLPEIYGLSFTATVDRHIICSCLLKGCADSPS